ncbi:unnamed protein product, partial [Strongylus vulgaris]
MSGYRETADLVRCPVTQQIMSAVLNKTDLNYGRYGFHNFYRIELMKRRDTDLWILFTNWGRIGSGVGEFQTTPFNNIDADLSNLERLKDYARQINWDASCPFGHITEAAIERARGILKQCELTVKELETTLAKET